MVAVDTVAIEARRNAAFVVKASFPALLRLKRRGDIAQEVGKAAKSVRSHISSPISVSCYMVSEGLANASLITIGLGLTPRRNAVETCPS